MVAHLWAICDSLAEAVQTAHPTWTVAVLLDPQTPAKSHPKDEDAIEVHIGPLLTHEQRGIDEHGGPSKRRMDVSPTICVRMRTRRVASDTEPLAREKSTAFDEVLTICERRSGLAVTEGVAATLREYSAFFDTESLRQDSLISIVGELQFFLIRRST